MEKIIVTGSAGFIGYHLSESLLKKGKKVIGIDCVNSYYEVSLKETRIRNLKKYDHFTFYHEDITDFLKMDEIYRKEKPDKVCNLAAQAGVRHSLTHPEDYIQSNIVGFFNMIELAKKYQIANFVYASSSSVYGNNKKIPFAVTDSVDHPISIYAATKKSNELIAHSYSHLYHLPTSGLRFFTAYGPWGRPDMALYIFARGIVEGKPIRVFNHGNMRRDFTYIKDIVGGIEAALDKCYPYEIFNLGNHHPEDLLYFISLIEKELGKEAIKEFHPMQMGDIPASFADITNSKEKLGFEPTVGIEQGIKESIEWFKEYYAIQLP